MKRKRQFAKLLATRLFALLLALIMMLGVIPAMATAEGLSADLASKAEQSESLSLDAKSEISRKLSLGETLFEVEAMREENVKHFRLDDGTFQAVIYADSVHRKGSNGAWSDIDNTLSTKNGKLVDSDGRVSFSPSIGGDGHIYSMTEDGYSIALNLVSGTSKKSTSAVVVNPTKKATVSRKILS